MTDFFEKEEPKTKEGEGGEETPSKIKLGEEEYSEEELKSFVDLGKTAKEIEKEHGSLKEFKSDWGRKAQKIGDLSKELEEVKKGEVEKKSVKGEELSEAEQIAKALADADKLGIVTKENIRRYFAQLSEAKDLLDTCSGLEEELSGSDGRPPFKTPEVLAYMEETGIKNPLKAWKDKYEEEIDKWKEESLKKAKPKGLVTEKSSTAGGAKEPKEVKITKGNLEEMMSAALEGEI